MSEKMPGTLHIAEGGFRPRQELLEAYGKRHQEFMPRAIEQAGFRETYGGPIPESPWWLFFAKFDTLETMENWQHERMHVQIQDEARNKWWSAYYLRKGRLVGDGEAISGKILHETMLLRNSQLSQKENGLVTAGLSEVESLKIVPYEAVKGVHLAKPYVFAQLAGAFPERAPVQYVLLTCWATTRDCAQWQESPAHRTVCQFGDTTSNSYCMIPERKPRMGLADDRMHRQWVAPE